MKVSLLLALTLVGLHSAAVASDAKPLPIAKHRYTVAALPPASGADFFQPRRINNRGDVVGHLDFSEGPFTDDPHAALYRKGVTIDLHLLVPGWETNHSSLPNDLNERGDAIFRVEGDYFIYRNGQLEAAPQLPGQYYFEPAALNNAGWIVGTVYFANSNPRAVFYNRGAFHWLGSPGVDSWAMAINDRGRIVGRSGDDAVILNRNGAVEWGTLSIWTVRINNHGDVLGNASVRFKNEAEVALSFAPAGMNERGEIVGSIAVTDSAALGSHRRKSTTRSTSA